MVVDRLRAGDGTNHSYEAQWHLAAEAAEAGGSRAQTVHPGGANLVILCSGPEPLEIVSGQTEPEWRGWRASEDPARTEPLRCPVVVSRWLAGNSRRLFLLLPVREGEKPGVSAIDGSANYAETSFAIRRGDGRQIVLDESELLREAA